MPNDKLEMLLHKIAKHSDQPFVRDWANEARAMVEKAYGKDSREEMMHKLARFMNCPCAICLKSMRDIIDQHIP